MSEFKYVLVGQMPVPCHDLWEWASWFERAERRVRVTRIGPLEISTVFLGVDQSWNSGIPLLFETMAFLAGTRMTDGGDYNRRYATWSEAERGHQRTVDEIRQPWDDVEEIYPEPPPEGSNAP